MDIRRIHHLKEKLSLSLSHAWTVAEMAAEVGLSVSYFHQTFKESFGVPPQIFLLDLRLEAACRLLEHESNFDSIKQIARIVGCENESHFCREFKKKFGITPSQYRYHHFTSIHPGIED